MTGDAFITHNNTWSCSNDCMYDVTRTPVFKPGTNEIVSLTQGWQLIVKHIFHATKAPDIGDDCKLVFKNESDDKQYGFIGQVQTITKEHTIIKIFSSTKEISEILSNITFKN